MGWLCELDLSSRSLAPPSKCDKYAKRIKEECVVKANCQTNDDCPNDEAPVCVDRLCHRCWFDSHCRARNKICEQNKCIEPICSKEGFGKGFGENCKDFGRACCKGLKCEEPIGFVPMPSVCVKDDSEKVPTPRQCCENANVPEFCLGLCTLADAMARQGNRITACSKYDTIIEGCFRAAEPSIQASKPGKPSGKTTFLPPLPVCR